jgi:hypothetical protein
MAASRCGQDDPLRLAGRPKLAEMLWYHQTAVRSDLQLSRPLMQRPHNFEVLAMRPETDRLLAFCCCDHGLGSAHLSFATVFFWRLPASHSERMRRARKALSRRCRLYRPCAALRAAPKKRPSLDIPCAAANSTKVSRGWTSRAILSRAILSIVAAISSRVASRSRSRMTFGSSVQGFYLVFAGRYRFC